MSDRPQTDRPQTDRLLAGTGAVVVGGSRGIEAAVAGLLARLGAGVVVNGRDADAVDETVARIGGTAVGFAGPASGVVAEALISLCENTFGRITALVDAPEPPSHRDPRSST